jgi:hypothetical protein
MFVATHCAPQVAGRNRRKPSALRDSGASINHAHNTRGSAVNRKLASVLVSLLFGWLATVAIAEDDTTAPATDSSAAMSEPAAATEESTDAATADMSTSDGTISATPAESEAK